MLDDVRFGSGDDGTPFALLISAPHALRRYYLVIESTMNLLGIYYPQFSHRQVPAEVLELAMFPRLNSKTR